MPSSDLVHFKISSVISDAGLWGQVTMNKYEMPGWTFKIKLEWLTLESSHTLVWFTKSKLRDLDDLM